jgi:integrating conjugative element protein (TIGR03761 family)
MAAYGLIARSFISVQPTMIEHPNPQSSPREDSDAVFSTENDAPGVLRGEVWLTVQSRHAQRLILGRAATLNKPAIVGLLGFADRLRVIWNADRADDPYADWWLIRIDEALERARVRIKSERAVLDDRIEQQSALQIDVATSDKPHRVALQFANPYAYWGAHLIAEFNTTARTILTAKHVGLISATLAERSLRGCAGAIRSLFAVPQGYRVLRIDRASVLAKNDDAKKAADCMGELPEAILLGERTAALTPHRAQVVVVKETVPSHEPARRQP